MTHVAFALLCGWASVAIGLAQSPAEAAAQLAGRISSQLQRRPTVSLEIKNLSPVAPADLSSFRNALDQELRKAGLAMTVTQPDTLLRVTISQSAQGLLLVAELLSDDKRSVILQPWISPPATGTKPRLRIVRKPVWDQPEPVLDLLLFNSESELLVLSPTAVTSFRMVDGKWVTTGVAALGLTRPPARDPRGRIETAPGGLRVYLPGTTCSGALQPALRFTCAAGNDAWPLNTRDTGFVAHWVTDQNVLEGEGFRGIFYTEAAGWFSNANRRIVDRSGNLIGVPEGWGSDFASVELACSPNPALLVSGPEANTDGDQALAYEITNGHAAVASEPITLPGPITALWAAESAGQATVVVRNSKTGNYEASRLGLACAE